MALRDLPSVDTLVRSLEGKGLPRLLVVDVARAAIDEARTITAAGGTADPHRTADAALQALQSLRHRPVLNATGVLLHTNLGRAPLAPAAAEAARAMATSYGNLEFDLEKARRGGRAGYAHRLVCALTGAEAALIVNNNAGALLLALAALGRRHPVAVSRGELIEIGGSYRLPELMAASGARMLEIGTTNRTRLADYEQALDDGAGMILKVHPSNYRVAPTRRHWTNSSPWHAGEMFLWSTTSAVACWTRVPRGSMVRRLAGSMANRASARSSTPERTW
ncbi:MAG: hypothetical protein GWP04_09290 [Gammaproteobacteria bacterium]|nr:hypothetical protein [Gammaproteobacteria bacterium]